MATKLVGALLLAAWAWVGACGDSMAVVASAAPSASAAESPAAGLLRGSGAARAPGVPRGTSVVALAGSDGAADGPVVRQPAAAAGSDVARSTAASGEGKGQSPPAFAAASDSRAAEVVSPSAAAGAAASAPGVLDATPGRDQEPRGGAEAAAAAADGATPRAAALAPAAFPEGLARAAGGACLCVFDIDRTLTGKQAAAERCPGDEVKRGVWDDNHGGGDLVLSALARAGVRSTACGGCRVGLVSSGTGGGGAMRGVLVAALGGGVPGDYSWPGNVRSPLIVGCSYKPSCVQAVMDWYNQRGAGISPSDVYLFDDKASNINSFYGKGFNAIQVSCASRDEPNGLCGATPSEVRLQRGMHYC